MMPHQQSALYQLSNDLADFLLEAIITAVLCEAHRRLPALDVPFDETLANGDASRGGHQISCDEEQV